MSRTSKRNSPNSFTASDYASALDFDFSEFDKPEGKLEMVKGDIPEPSDAMIGEYMRRQRDLAREYDIDIDEDEEDREKIKAAMDAMDDIDMEDLAERQAEDLAYLCGGVPNKATLIALPFRVRKVFQTWVVTRLTDPESSAAGTTNSQVRKIGG